MENLTKGQKIMTKPDTYAFKEFLKTIPLGDYPNTVKRIKDECMMNDYRFVNIKSGIARIKPLEFEKINLIAGYDILEKFKKPSN